jgi:predicted  nucleic acid-binding Zn-ribbon protein
MHEDINSETIYEGSRACAKCGHLMTPVESLYAGGDACPTCRNAKYAQHAKSFMAKH